MEEMEDLPSPEDVAINRIIAWQQAGIIAFQLGKMALAHYLGKAVILDCEEHEL